MHCVSKYSSAGYSIQNFMSKLPIYKEISEKIRQYATGSFPIVNDPRSIKLQFKAEIQHRHMRERVLSVDEKNDIAENLLKINPDASRAEIFCKKPWDIEAFNVPHLPTSLGVLQNKKEFSKRQGDNYFLFMDMPIYLVGKGWKIPEELAQFGEVIEQALAMETLINPNMHDYNVYITVDQREVAPGKSQRRTGWHGDSYINVETRLDALEGEPNIETDSIYLVSDCIPTEFCAGPFPFKLINPNNTEQVLNHFEEGVKGKEIVTYDPYTLLRLTPECVHQVGLNKSEKAVARTFVKITFSRQILNREGNQVNPLFDVNWPMYARDSSRRNHSSVVDGYHQNLDDFRQIDDLDAYFSKKDSNPSVTFIAKKTATISAYLATPGELLQTIQEGFVTTVNVAKPGDWKVTTSTGTQYFLSSEKVDRFYMRDSKLRADGNLIPRDAIVAYKTVEEPIKFMAPWQSMQFLRKGDYLVKRGDELYGILREDFEAHYTKADSHLRE